MGGLARADEADADPQAENSQIQYIADSSTALGGRDILAQEGGRYAGRVWSDKSVYTNDNVVLNAGVNVEKGDADFLTIFSALGSSRNVTSRVKLPLDVVFVIDISGSMNTALGDSNRIAATIDAVNGAIATLMDKKQVSEYSRVGIAVFSGGDNARTILPLGRYEATAGTADDPVYIAMTRTSTDTSGDNVSQFQLSVRRTDEGAGTIQTGSISVVGGTNTQMGIYTGMNMLANTSETTATIKGDNGSLEVSRIPAMVLLSDGQPTYSSSSQSWWEPSGRNQQGPGSSSYYGNGMLAMMTAAYMKDVVDDHYKVANQSDENRARYEVKIYTVGMGLSEDATGANAQLARVTLNPTVYLGSNNNMANSIREAWNEYRSGETPRIRVNQDANINRYTLTHPTSNDITSDPNALQYNDAYYSAGTNVGEVFQNIIEVLVNEAFVPTQDTTGTAAATGLLYTDPIGDYMEVDNVQSVILFGQKYPVTYNKATGTCTVQSASITHPVTGTLFNTSDITITVETDKTDPQNPKQTLRVNVPSVVLPIQCETIDVDIDNNIQTYSTNANTRFSFPLRVVYTVSIRDDLKDASGSVDLSKVDDEYIKAHTAADGSVSFYTNEYDAGATNGKATVQFSPSEKNRYYYFQKTRTIFATAEGLVNGEADLTVNGAAQSGVSVGAPVTSATLDPETTYYLVIDYYRPGPSGAGEYVEHIVSRTGAELQGSVALTSTDDPAKYIATGDGGHTVLATKVGGARLGRLNNFTLQKSDNETETASNAYVPTYTGGGESGLPTANEAFTVYLGNNGKESVPTSSLLIGKTVAAQEGITAPASQEFDFKVELERTGASQAATQTIEAQLYRWTVPADGDPHDGRYEVVLDEQGKAVIRPIEFTYDAATNKLTATLKLRDGEALLFTDLAPGSTYAVAEETTGLAVVSDSANSTATGFKFVQLEQNGSVVAQGANEVTGTIEAYAQQRVIATNEYVSTVARTTLPIIKNLSGRMFQTGDSFTFTVTAAPLVEGGAQPNDTPLPTDADGNVRQSFTFTPTAEEIAAGTTQGTIDILKDAPITFTKPGTYAYIIQEQQGNIAGVTYDNTLYRVEVEVVAVDENGNPSATGAFLKAERVRVQKATLVNGVPQWGDAELPLDTAMEFNNTYSATETSSHISVQKTLEGRALEEGEFQFVLEAAGSRVHDGDAWSKDDNQPLPGGTVGNPVTVATNGGSTIEVSNGANGNAVFANILFTAAEAGALGDPRVGVDYLYRVSEKHPDGAQQSEDGKWTYQGVTYSDTVYDVIIHVYTSQDPDDPSRRIVVADILDAEGNPIDLGPLTFTNTYTAQTTVSLLGGTKTITGRDFKTGDAFEFDASATRAGIPMPDPSSVVIEPATGNSQTFGFGAITFTQADAARPNGDGTGTGRHYYYLEENPGKLGGIAYDSARYRVAVDVTDDGKGVLTATVAEVAKDSGEGFEVLAAPAGGWTYEAVQQNVVFTNEYTATPAASVTLRGTKELVGRTLHAEDFAFTIAAADADGNPLPTVPDGVEGAISASMIVSNGAVREATPDGVDKADVMFLGPVSLQYTQPGTYYYLMSENQPESALPGMTYSMACYLVGVEVVDDGNGALVASVASVRSRQEDGSWGEVGVPEGGWTSDALSSTVVFRNEYAGASLLPLGITKQLLGGVLEEGAYQFVLEVTPADENTPADGVVLPQTVVSNGAGAPYNVNFDEVRFTKPGTYTITAREVIPEGADRSVEGFALLNGVAYDTHEVSSTITVTADDDGNLTAVRSGTTGNRVFNNSYGIGLSKSVQRDEGIDDALAAQPFTFDVALAGEGAADGTYPVQYQRIDGSSPIEALTFTDGHATVELRDGETATLYVPGGVACTIAEKTPDGWQVVAPQGGSQTVTLTADVPAPEVAFVNAYAVGNLAVSKTVVGEDAPADAMFVFDVVLTDEAGTVLADATYTYTLEDGGEVFQLVPNDGRYTLELKADQTATITGLPKGARYIVTERTGEMPLGFEFDSAEGSEGVIAANATSEAAFTNAYAPVPDPEKTASTPADPTGSVAAVGDVLTYRVSWANTATLDGKAAAAKVTVTDTIPAGTTFVEGSAKLLDAAGNEVAGFAGPTPANGVLTWEIDAEARQSGYVSFQVQVDESALTLDKVTNTAKVQIGENGPTVDTNPKETSIPSKEVTADQGFENGLKVGDVLIYTVRFANYSGASQTCTVTDKIPSGTEFVSASYADGSDAGEPLDGVMTWKVPLAHGDSSFVTLRVRVAESAYTEDTLTNTASVQIGENGPTVNTNPVDIDAKKADLQIAKSVTAPDGVVAPDADFMFEVALSDNSDNGGASLTGAYTYKVDDGEPVALTTDDSGRHTLTLKAGQTATILGLPVGTTYTVTEVGLPAGFSQKAPEGVAQGAVTADGARVEFVNEYRTEGVTVEGPAQLRGTKVLEGRNQVPGEFAFELKAAAGDNTTADAIAKGSLVLGGNPGATSMLARNGADGSWQFGDLRFDRPGTYRFTVSEVEVSLGSSVTAVPGVTYDKTTYDVTVVVTDDQAGKLAAEVQGVPEGGFTFKNTYASEAKTTPHVDGLKILEGRTLQEREFSFALSGYGIEGEAVATNDADGRFAFDLPTLTVADLASAVPNDQGVRTATFEYRLREVAPGSDNQRQGVTYSTESYKLTVTLTDNGKGLLSHTVSAVDSAGNAVSLLAGAQTGLRFVNSYVPETASDPVVLAATKTLVGLDLAEDAFSFVVEDLDGNPVSVGSNAAAQKGEDNASHGAVTFGSIVYDAASMADATQHEDGTRSKDFTYVMREVDPGAGRVPGVDFYDGRTYRAVVTVTDDGNGRLSASEPTYYDADGNLWSAVPEFVNHYSVSDDEFVPVGISKVTDAHVETDLNALTFGFAIYQQGDRTHPVATGTSGANGLATFTPIPVEATGEFWYDIVEDRQGVPAGGVTYDGSVYRLKLEVTDAGDGTYAMVPSYYAVDADGASVPLGDGAYPVFRNSYDTEDLYVSIDGVRKLVNGEAPGERGFSFELIDDATGVVQYGRSDAAGNVTFGDLHYQYRVPEKPEEPTAPEGDQPTGEDPAQPDDSAQADPGDQPATPQEPVTPTEPGPSEEPDAGENPSVPDGPAISDEPTGSDESAEPEVPAESLNPEVPEETGGSSDAAPEGEGSEPEGFSVPDLLDATVAYATDEAAEVQVFEGPASALEGEAAGEGENGARDARTVDEPTSAEQPGEPEVSEGGDAPVESEPVSSDLGDHWYTIREVVPEGATYNDDGSWTYRGVTYDTAVYRLCVTVRDNGDGTLTADVTSIWYINGADQHQVTSLADVVFRNTYEATVPARAVFEADKTLTGRDARDGEFGFVVRNGEGAIVATGRAQGAPADQQAPVEFVPLWFDKAGVYAFTIEEVRGGQTTAGVTYDASRALVRVTVVDQGDGTLAASVEYLDADGATLTTVPSFLNKYAVEKEGVASLEVSKVLNGRDGASGEFSFAVYSGDTLLAGGQAPALTDGKGATFKLGNVYFAQPGEYDLVVVEVAQGTATGVVYDPTRFAVHVMVTDAGDGTLACAVSYPEGGVAFVNGYEAKPATVSLVADKALAGRDLVAGEFSFQVTDPGSGALVTTGVNDGEGLVYFDEFKLAKAGSYDFVMAEVAGTEQGVAYDERTFTAHVEVTDDGVGQLQAEVTYPDGNARFKNTFTPPQGPGEYTHPNSHSHPDAWRFHPVGS